MKLHLGAKRIRLIADIPLRTAATALGTSHSKVANVENGVREDRAILSRAVDYYGGSVPLVEILGVETLEDVEAWRHREAEVGKAVLDFLARLVVRH
jgi:hypothetical protein